MGGRRFILDSDDDEDSEAEVSSRIPPVTSNSITVDVESPPPTRASRNSDDPSTGSTGMSGILSLAYRITYIHHRPAPSN